MNNIQAGLDEPPQQSAAHTLQASLTNPSSSFLCSLHFLYEFLSCSSRSGVMLSWTSGDLDRSRRAITHSLPRRQRVRCQECRLASLANTQTTNLTLLTGFLDFGAVVHSEISLRQFRGSLQAKCRHSPTDACEVYDNQPKQVEYVHFLQGHHLHAKINSRDTVVERRST